MRPGIRTVIRLLLSLLILAIIFPFALPLKEGRPLLSLSDLKLPNLRELPKVKLPQLSSLGDKGQPRREGEVVIIYRWRGEDGNWQFSNVAPPAGVEYESVTVQPDANLLPATAAEQPEAKGDGEPPALSLPLTLTPQQLGELFDKARGVQKLMDERRAQQEKASR